MAAGGVEERGVGGKVNRCLSGTLAAAVCALWIVVAICEIAGAHWLSGFDRDHNQVLPVLAWISFLIQAFNFVSHLSRNAVHMTINLVLLALVNIGMVATIICYSRKYPETKLEHDIYDNKKGRVAVIAISCTHGLLWIAQMIICIWHRSAVAAQPDEGQSQ